MGALTISLVLAIVVGWAPRRPADAASGASSTALRTDPTVVRSHYAGAVMRGGRLDAAATIAALQHQGVNVYTYLIRTSQEWQDLPSFLRAAEGTGITVWAYLVSPSSAPRPAGLTTDCWSKSYVNGGDYVSIFRSLGRLSHQFPWLTAISIDDFAQNAADNPRAKCRAFSPAKVARMRAAARGWQPRIKFLPVLYNRDFAGATIKLARYLPNFDGSILPYRAETQSSPGRWTVSYYRTGPLRFQIKRASAAMVGTRKLYLMHYAIHRCEPGEPLPWKPGVCKASPSLLKSMVATSLAESANGLADGVVIYRHPLSDLADPRLVAVRSLFAR